MEEPREPPTIPQPERTIPHEFATENTPLALQIRLILGREALNPQNTDLPDTDATQLPQRNRETSQETNKKIATAATHTSLQRWETRIAQDPTLQTHQAQVDHWKRNFTGAFVTQENQTHTQILNRVELGGIDLGALNNETAQRLYDRYVARRGENQVDAIVSGNSAFINYNIDLFIGDIKGLFRNDHAELERNLDHFTFLARKIFGREASECISNKLLGEIKATTQAEEFTDNANEKADKNGEKSRQNWLEAEVYRYTTVDNHNQAVVHVINEEQLLTWLTGFSNITVQEVENRHTVPQVQPAIVPNSPPLAENDLRNVINARRGGQTVPPIQPPLHPAGVLSPIEQLEHNIEQRRNEMERQRLAEIADMDQGSPSPATRRITEIEREIRQMEEDIERRKQAAAATTPPTSVVSPNVTPARPYGPDNPLRPSPKQQELLAGAQRLQFCFEQVFGQPTDRTNEFYVTSPPASLNLTPQELQALELRAPFFINIRQNPNNPRSWSWNTNRRVVPHVRYGADGDEPQQRFVNAEHATNGDSGMFALAAMSSPDPQRQAQLYRDLADVVLKAHENNKELLKQWIHAQGEDQTGDDISTSKGIFKHYDLERALNLNDAQLQAREMLVQTDNRGKYNEVINQQVWVQRIDELNQAIRTDALKPHHFRWLEFLSHSVDIAKVVRDMHTAETATTIQSAPNPVVQKMTEMINVEITNQIREGKPEGLTQLFDLYGPELYDFLGRLTGDRDESTRLLENTFIGIPKEITTLSSQESVRGWLYSLAREAGMNWLRQKSALHALPRSDEPYAPGLGDDIWKAARAIPAFHRATLIVEELTDLSPQEKNRALGLKDPDDIPRLVGEARKLFNRAFDNKAETEGRPKSGEIDQDRIRGLRSRTSSADKTLFSFLPQFILPEPLKKSLRQSIPTKAATHLPEQHPAQTTKEQAQSFLNKYAYYARNVDEDKSLPEDDALAIVEFHLAQNEQLMNQLKNFNSSQDPAAAFIHIERTLTDLVLHFDTYVSNKEFKKAWDQAIVITDKAQQEQAIDQAIKKYIYTPEKLPFINEIRILLGGALEQKALELVHSSSRASSTPPSGGPIGAANVQATFSNRKVPEPVRPGTSYRDTLLQLYKAQNTEINDETGDQNDWTTSDRLKAEADNIQISIASRLLRIPQNKFNEKDNGLFRDSLARYYSTTLLSKDDFLHKPARAVLKTEYDKYAQLNGITMSFDDFFRKFEEQLDTKAP